MRTKLLKEVRKNYKIMYYPEGYKSAFGEYYFKNAYVLYFKEELIRADFNRGNLIDALVIHFKSEKKLRTLIK